MARKPEITPQAILTICEGVRSMLSFKDAAERANITDATLRNWRNRGKKEAEENAAIGERQEKPRARRGKGPDVALPLLTADNLRELAALPFLPDELQGFNTARLLFFAFFVELQRARADSKAALLGSLMSVAIPHRVERRIVKTRTIVVKDVPVEVTDTEIHETSEVNVRANVFLLERRWPEEFGPRLDLVNRKVDPEKLARVLSDEQLQRWRDGANPIDLLLEAAGANVGVDVDG